MTITFDPYDRMIMVQVKITGPTGSLFLLAALDTGATMSVINKDVLEILGYDLNDSNNFNKVPLIVANGVISAPQITLDSFYALEQEKHSFPVLFYNMPATSPLDAIIGLDFLRNHILTLDFTVGKLTLV